jgi:hypothetical protein
LGQASQESWPELVVAKVVVSSTGTAVVLAVTSGQQEFPVASKYPLSAEHPYK